MYKSPNVELYKSLNLPPLQFLLAALFLFFFLYSANTSLLSIFFLNTFLPFNLFGQLGQGMQKQNLRVFKMQKYKIVCVIF